MSHPDRPRRPRRPSTESRPRRRRPRPHAPTGDAATPALGTRLAPPRTTTPPAASANGTPIATPPRESSAPRRRIAPPHVDRRRLTAPVGRSYNSARRTWIAVLFLPVFAIYLVFDAVRELRYRWRRDRAGSQPRRVAFERPSAMPRERADRSVADVVGHLERIPYDPLQVSTQVAFAREYGPEGFGILFASQPALASLPHAYPGVFRERLYAGHDGAQIAAIQALHDRPGPALVICHGLLTSKNFDYIRTISRRAYSEWGFHVVALDLRGWGNSSWTNDAPSSAGWAEGFDVLEVARELLRDTNVTSVGLLGYSLGGSAVLNAARHSSASEDKPIQGGVFTVSAPTEIERAIKHISKPPGWRDAFFPSYVLFQAALRANVRKLGHDTSMARWSKLVSEHSAPWYGVSFEEYCERASAAAWASEIEVPTLALHAADDFLVPVSHAYALRDAAADNDNVHVWVTDAGAHCAFTSIDQRWFHSVTRRWFEYWATEPKPEPNADELM